jgi:putative transposase
MYNKEPEKFNKLSKSALFNQLFTDEKGCPYDTLTDEYSKFLTNLKSAFTNLKKGNIKHFQVAPKKRVHGRSMFVSHRSVTNNGIFPTLLGEISNFSKILDVKKIECDCRLVYLNKTGKFYLHVPQYVERKIIVCRDPVCSIDPGEKIFISTYSVFESGKIGEDIRKPILAYQSNIKQYQRVLSSNKNKDGNKLRNKRSLKKKIQQQYDNIHNLVRELHHQTANYLCKSYDNIIIPKFETQKMVKNAKPIYTGTPDEIKKQIRTGSKKIRLSRRVKFVLNMLSHYKFRQHLEAKCDEYGCNLEICSEEYTTQCCGKCGFLSKRFEQRTKICTKCGHKINRDINGARNILIKNYKSVMDFKKTE